VEDGGDVDVDDVARLQHARPGDAVADHLVDGGAHALGEAVVVEGRRPAAALDRVLVDEGVDLLPVASASATASLTASATPAVSGARCQWTATSPSSVP